MAAGAFIAAHSNPFNRSVLKENAIYFTDPTEVCSIIDQHEGWSKDNFIQNNYATILNDFTWDKIIDQYDLFFRECYLSPAERSFIQQPQLVEQLIESE